MRRLIDGVWAIALIIPLVLCVVCCACSIARSEGGDSPPDVSLDRTPLAPEAGALAKPIVPESSSTLTPTPPSPATSTIRSTPTASPSPTPLSPTPTSTPIPFLVAIDAGHGGRDLGACRLDDEGRLDFTESEVNLDIALRIGEVLRGRGYQVLLIRDGDYLLNAEEQDVNGDGKVSPLDESQARVDLINAAGADLLLAIHQNAFALANGQPVQDVGGAVTFYCADRSFSDENLRFAELVQEAVVQAFHDVGYEIRDRGVMEDLVLEELGKPGSYLVLLGPETERIVRPCQVPGALSEPLFITHRREAELARDEAFLDHLATAYADAVCRYFAGDKARPTATVDPL
ncbi:MAG: N-acetylmuramoyl-L-alanine amidase [Anaerolineae bacterium]